MQEPGALAGDVRGRTSALIRERQAALTAAVATAMSIGRASLAPSDWRRVAGLLVRVFASAVERGSLETEETVMRELTRYAPPLTTRELVEPVHVTERVILDDVALDEHLGATSDGWGQVTHVIRRAALDVLGAYAGQPVARDAPLQVRDPLTTLIAGSVFDLALAQEIQRAMRSQHPLAVLLFDMSDVLSQINREHGWGVGDRLLERTGITARRFFRTHDWVARYSTDSIAVLLPETTLDQAGALAARFRNTVQQRLVFKDHNTGASQTVTVSAAAVGTDLVQSELDGAFVMSEAQSAVLRAKLSGRNRIEQIALLPTSVTIFGAASLLGHTPREIAALIKSGTLQAARRGRHYHINRNAVDSYKKSGARR